MKFLKQAMLAGLVVALASGCTGYRRNRAAGRDANVAGVTGTDVYGEDLMPGRDLFEGGSELANMFTAVYFDYDSSQINPGERGKLDEVAAYLRRSSGVRLILEGHTDERGSREYNLGLGERRALAARAYLLSLGIPAERMQTKSMGKEKPVAMGHDESAWRLNRRVEFILIQ